MRTFAVSFCSRWTRRKWSLGESVTQQQGFSFPFVAFFFCCPPRQQDAGGNKQQAAKQLLRHEFAPESSRILLGIYAPIPISIYLFILCPALNEESF